MLERMHAKSGKHSAPSRSRRDENRNSRESRGAHFQSFISLSKPTAASTSISPAPGAWCTLDGKQLKIKIPRTRLSDVKNMNGLVDLFSAATNADVQTVSQA